jgi:endonuclease/exonuclease/phosphatase family metal-dependent hydrolase
MERNGVILAHVMSLRLQRSKSPKQQPFAKKPKPLSSSDQRQKLMFRSLSVILLTFCIIVLLSVFRPSPMIVPTKSKSSNDPPSRPTKRVKVQTSEEATSLLLLLSLKLVSMNVAEFIPAAVAPSTWDDLQSAQALRSELLQSDPDIIALQEVPDGHGELLEQLFGDGGGTTNGGYTMVGSSPAHAGNVALLVRTFLFQSVVRVPVVYDKGSALPVVMAQIHMKDHSSENGGHHHIMVVVASCHLAPFESGSDQRRRQVKIILEAAAAAVGAETTEMTDATTGPAKGQQPLLVVLAGDTNMRDEEDNTMEHDEFQLLDAWKLAGSDPATRYSWDTVDHAIHGDGNYFNQYYGSRTRQYQRRYDRIYLSSQPDEQENSSHDQQQPSHNDGKVITTVPNFQLIANQPLLGSTNHFLSDHFGISAQINVALECATHRSQQECNNS